MTRPKRPSHRRRITGERVHSQKPSFLESRVRISRISMPAGKSSICVVVGLLFFLFGLWMLTNSISLSMHGTQTTGTVINVWASGRSTNYDVRFIASDERVILFTTSPWEVYQRGDTVSVLYNSKEPQQATLTTAADLWALPVILCVFGAAGFLVGFVGLVPKRPKGSRS